MAPQSKKHISKKHVAEALKKAGGFESMAAQILGCSQQNISGWVKRHPDLRAVIEATTELKLDRAEFKLSKLIEDENLGAICFYLKCKGKKRGYSERESYYIEPDLTPVLQALQEVVKTVWDNPNNDK